MGQAVGSTDVVVLGGGPAGYVAAIRAAQLGKKVILVDKSAGLGGVCLHHGCIPSKALIHASDILYQTNHAEHMGITISNATIDFAKTQEWKQTVIDTLAGGIAGLCKKYGVQVIRAKAYYQSSREIGLEPLSEDEHLEYGALECRYSIIATGSSTRALPSVPFDGKAIVGSDELLNFDHIPKTLLIIGGGYIGVEMATVFAKLGSRVTIVEKFDRLIPAVDEDISTVLLEHCKTLGIDIRFHTEVAEHTVSDTGAQVQLKTDDGKTASLEVERIMVAIGRQAHTDELQLNNTSVTVDDHGFIETNDTCLTKDAHIYAIGDVAGGALLAHKASMEGRIAAEVIAGKNVTFDMQVVPAVIFSDPEIAMVGMTQRQAEKEGYTVKTGVFPFKASGRALTMNQPEGFVKVVADEKSHLILGVHIVGVNASDLISEASLAIEMGARAEDVSQTIHPHPTLSESLSEAMQGVLGNSVHIFHKK